MRKGWEGKREEEVRLECGCRDRDKTGRGEGGRKGCKKDCEEEELSLKITSGLAW